MKKFIFSVACLILILSQACTSKSEKKISLNKLPTKKSRINLISGEPQKCVYKVVIGHDTIPVIKQVFVINKYGIKAYVKPAKKTEPVIFDYGEKLYVIAQTASDYIIAKNYSKFYISKQDAVEETDIPLNSRDLNEAYYNDRYDQPERYTNIEVSIVTKEKYDHARKTGVDFFKPDTQLFKKKDGKFAIKYERRFQKYTDTKETTYDYMGDFKFLNCHVLEIASDEAERSMFYLFDKKTGVVQSSYPTLPYFSSDKKRIICVDAAGAQMVDVYVYSNEKDNVRDYAFGRYRNWLPADTQNMFWGKDGCFYLPVLPTISYRNRWNNDLCLPQGYNYRYVKIKVTGPTPPKPEIQSEADSASTY